MKHEMQIEDMTAEQRRDAVDLARSYMHYAGLARAAEKDGADENTLRDLVGKARHHEILLAQRYGLTVADDEDGETNYGVLVELLTDPKAEQVIVAFDAVSTSQHEPYLIEDEAPDFYGSYAVDVAPEMVTRWRQVAQDWAAVQGEMRMVFEAARRASGDHETVQNLMSRFEHEDRWRADHAAYVAAEAELDETEGVREWARTTYQVKINKYQSATRWRIHKRGCPSLDKVFDNGPTEPVHVVRAARNEALVRKAEAVSLLRDPDTVICQRCAKELEAELS